MIVGIGGALFITAFMGDSFFGRVVRFLCGLGLIIFGGVMSVAGGYFNSCYERTGEVGRYAIIETKDNGVVEIAGVFDLVVELEFTYDKGNGALETIKPLYYEYVYDVEMPEGKEYIVIYNSKFCTECYFFSAPRRDFTAVTIYTSDANKGGIDIYSSVEQNLEVILEGF